MKEMDNHIRIFDTTLRDGEQSPGCSMNLKEKIEVAKCLERLKVDIIEAGFAISSPGDFESVKTVSEVIKDCTVASLARCVEKDIDAAWDAVKGAADPRLHVFLATSPLHMQYKLKMTEDQVIERTAAMVKYARNKCSNIEFSCEDATRSDYDFMVKVVNAAIASGATTINLPDTVGYTTPAEMGELITYVKEHIDRPEDIIFSVHCHNDLGMAAANSLAGVKAGARQIECTINGLGERAGNTSMEEVVMALRTRPDVYGAQSRIDTTQIYKASKTVYTIIGQTAPLNKPIVGRNAFAHESGIHQHGVLANKATYEIMTPESVGISINNIVLGKHSGKHAFETRLQTLGYELTPEELLSCFEEFKIICDKKKVIDDDDLEAIVNHNAINDAQEDGYKLDWFSVNTSNFTTATCTVSLERNGEKFQEVCLGDGPLDAAFGAINKIIKPEGYKFADFTVHSNTVGQDSLGNATIKLEADNRTCTGHGISTDVIQSSINAYLQAINKMLSNRARIAAHEAAEA